MRWGEPPTRIKEKAAAPSGRPEEESLGKGRGKWDRVTPSLYATSISTSVEPNIPPEETSIDET